MYVGSCHATASCRAAMGLWDQISNLRLAVAKRTFCEGHFRCTLAQTHLSILRPSRPLTPFVRHAATGLQGPLAIP
jgi:hypothetical protein